MSFHTHIEEACSACDDLYQELARLRVQLRIRESDNVRLIEERDRLREENEQLLAAGRHNYDEVGRLREALRPFVKNATEAYVGKGYVMRVTVAQYDIARNALKEAT